jgi:hypothetical protein
MPQRSCGSSICLSGVQRRWKPKALTSARVLSETNGTRQLPTSCVFWGAHRETALARPVSRVGLGNVASLGNAIPSGAPRV